MINVTYRPHIHMRLQSLKFTLRHNSVLPYNLIIYENQNYLFLLIIASATLLGASE